MAISWLALGRNDIYIYIFFIKKYFDVFLLILNKVVLVVDSWLEDECLYPALFFFFLKCTLKNARLLLSSTQSMYSRVPECQITTYYYVGFAYLMMRRYQDAIRVFANILLYIQRTRNMFQRSTYKYEMVSICVFNLLNIWRASSRLTMNRGPFYGLVWKILEC